MKITVANIYNPQNQTKEELIAGFVVRQQLFRKLFKVIKEGKMDTPEQHYLILGRRGMGKTTLLLRLAYEIENDPDLNTWLIPLVFNEEEYGIRNLFKFWERVMELLEEKHSAFRFEEAMLRQLNRQFPTDHDAYEKALFNWLSAELTQQGKKLILFVDNFGDMARKLSDTEAHRLRKILQTSTDIRLFAASSVVLEAFYKYDHAFYEFFKQVELKELDEDETHELLLALSQHYKKEDVRRIVKQKSGRVEALRRITNGVIRSIVLLFEIFADDGDGGAFQDLQIILDRISPLYKHRMDDLSDQQQAIVEVIALHWDAISVKEIAEQTRLESKIVSAQLNNLEKNGIVEKRPTYNKNHLYLISERFFNIWFLMRLGRKSDQKRVLWLVKFFEAWLDKDLLKDRAERHLDALRKGGFYPESAFYITQALALTKDIDPVSRHKLLTESKIYLAGLDLELAQSLSPSDLDIAVEVIEKWYKGQRKEAIQLLRLSRTFDDSKMGSLLKNSRVTLSFQHMEKSELSVWEEAMGDFSCDTGWIFYYDLQKKEIGWQCLELSAQSGFPRAMNRLGRLYQNEYKELAKAEEWYLKAAEKGHAGAMRRLGRLYQDEYKEMAKAEQWYLKAVAKGNINAMWLLGSLYQIEHKDLIKAEKWYLKAIEKGSVGAMWLLGWLYQNEHKNITKAKGWYLKAAEKGNAIAMRNLGWLYQNEYKDLIKAEGWYLKAAEKGDASAMWHLGYLYQNEQTNTIKAEEWYLKAAEKDNTDAMWYLGSLFQNERKDLPRAEEWYLKAAQKGDADAMLSLGVLYKNEHNDFSRAEEWYLKAAEKGNISAMNNLGSLYQDGYKNMVKAEQWYLKAAEKGDADAMLSLGVLYKNEYKDIIKAEEWCLKAAEKDHARAMFNLGWLYQNEHKDLVKAEKWYLKAADYGNFDGINSLLWHNRITEALNVSLNFFWDQELQKEGNDAYLLFLTLLLAKNQQQALYDIFTSPQGQEQNFKDRYKPIWYAILKKLDHPDFLRMGDELKQTVEEILAKAEQLAEDYK